MRIPSRLALLSSVFALCSCTTVFFNDLGVPSTATPKTQLQAKGFQLFQCSRDKYGYYWRFIAPEVSIYDAENRLFATQGADFNLIAPDGSKLKAKIVASDKSVFSSNSHLKDVLFQVTPHGAVDGSLSKYRWIRRSQAEGGIPQSTCTAKRRGQAIKVAFSALYTFYTDDPR